MKCHICGFEDATVRQYCPQCGAEMDLSAREYLAALGEHKKRERERAVFTALARWLAAAVVTLIVLFALKAAFTAIPRERVQVHFPAPRVNIVDPQRLSLSPARLPAPDEKPLGYGPAEEDEDDVVKKLLQEAFAQAPKYRLGTSGKVVRGFILKRFGDAVTLFTLEGTRIVPASFLTPLD